jgi:PAS domain S-box-containing protein
MHSVGLDFDQLFAALEFANPHTLFVDANLTIFKVGKAFQKSSDHCREGKQFSDLFRWMPGNGFEKLTENRQILQFIESIEGNQRYKISGRKTEWGFVLHGNPIVNADFHISDYNLTLKDFSQQNYIAEYLFLLQSSSKALEELQAINKDYLEKNRALEQSREELISTSLFPNENPNPVLRVDEGFNLLYNNPASTVFLEDFSFDRGKLTDSELKDALSNILKDEKEISYSNYQRNNRTYLLNIRCNVAQKFFNIYATDITRFVELEEEKEREMKFLNNRLEEQQQFYEYILNNIPSDIAVFDEQHRYLFVNPQGIKNDEIRQWIIGKDDFEYCRYRGLSEEGAAFRRAKFLEVLRENKEVEWEDDRLDQTGNRSVIMRRMRPIFNAVTHKTNVVGYGIDITQRKLAEDRLLQSKIRLQLQEQFLNASSDAIQVAGQDGYFVYINQAASDRLGIASDKIHEYKVSDIDPQFKDPKVWQEHLAFLQEHRGFSAESFNVNQQTGEVIDVEVKVRYLEIDGQGYIIAASRDISERKLNERILVNKTEFQRLIMEVATEFIDVQQNDLQQLINNTLARLGNFMEVDRVYIFDYNHEQQTTSNTFEWVAEGVEPEIDNLQDIPFEYVPVWVETHFKGANIEVENTSMLPDGGFKELLLEQNIKSLIALPMMLDGVCIGFVGLDSVKDFRRFYEDEKVLLNLLARMLVNVKERIRATTAIYESNEKIRVINEELQHILQAEKTVNLLADSFLTGNNYEDICWDIVENIITQLDFEDCVIYKADGKELTQIAAMGNKTRRRRELKSALSIPVGQGIVGTVAKTGKPLLISDTSVDERYILDDERRFSELAVPIKIGRKVWGVIDSENPEKHFFTPLHERVLLTIANMLSQKIEAIEEQTMKEKLQKEIVAMNQELETRVIEETNRNIELSKSITDQEKLVTIGEIASGIAHDLNTPLGAIKIGAESIRYTIDNLLSVVSLCSERQIQFALNRSIEQEGELFVGGLQQRKEMKELDSFLLENYPAMAPDDRNRMMLMFSKTRILTTHPDLIREVLSTENPFEFLELIYNLQIIRNFVQTILTSSERATKVIQDLRSYIKDQRNTERGPVNVRKNIETVLNVFNYEIKRSVELVFEVDDALFIEGYDIKLFQLWSNIIKNAIESLDQYRERGIIKISSESSEETIIIRISNNGPKIPEDIKTKIFEKFFTTKAARNGSGLGLSIVRSTLEDHEAMMELISDDEWTTFSFTFKKLNYKSSPKNTVEIELL